MWNNYLYIYICLIYCIAFQLTLASVLSVLKFLSNIYAMNKT
jgi:hypothetical protein